MIHFDRPPEPADFDTKVRIPGKEWLSRNHGKTPKDFWTTCKAELAEGFSYLCGYCAMFVPVKDSQVEHYRSKSKYPEEAYDWDNYRYASPKINQWKSDSDEILDPFEVEDGWFEVQLSSLQLIRTRLLPTDKNSLAKSTLDRLRLGTGEDLIKERRAYYREFLEGDCTLGSLSGKAPLIGRAVEKVLQGFVPQPEDEDVFRLLMRGRCTLGEVERRAPRLAERLRFQLPPCGENPDY